MRISANADAGASPIGEVSRAKITERERNFRRATLGAKGGAPGERSPPLAIAKSA
jgi:hypothetical protein